METQPVMRLGSVQERSCLIQSMMAPRYVWRSPVPSEAMRLRHGTVRLSAADDMMELY